MKRIGSKLIKQNYGNLEKKKGLKKPFGLGFAFLMVISATFIHAIDPQSSLFSSSEPPSLLTQNQDFDRKELLAPSYRWGDVTPGFSFLNPNRFSMHQSYSVNFSSGSMGASSAGLYLNTLNYKLAAPLTLSADVGFYSPLYSSSAGSFGSRGIQDPTRGSSMIFPRLGLEYKPSQNTTFSIQLLNGQDATKAYGYPSPFLNPWSR